ncbi:unnamed protein product [Caenorhabditis brenneri]
MLSFNSKRDVTGTEYIRDELFVFFKQVAVEINVANEWVTKESEKILTAKPSPTTPVKESQNFWLAFLITVGVIVLLGAFIIGPIVCCLKKRGAFSSEHVNEDIDFPDEEQPQRSPKQLAVSPALSPARGVSPVAKSPKSPGIARTPRTARTPTKRAQPRGLSPMGLSPMRNRSY